MSSSTDIDDFNLIISKIQNQDENGDVAMALTVDMLKVFMGEYLEKFTKSVEAKIDDANNHPDTTHQVKILEITPEQLCNFGLFLLPT